MDLQLDRSLGDRYSSNSQRARVMTEDWVGRSLYCPNCGYAALQPFSSNRKAADFSCVVCAEEFELKSGTRFGRQIVNGAFDALCRRLREDNNPNLILLRYSRALSVERVEVIPREFFTESIVVARPPLPASARRAGWVGCNIRLTLIPAIGRIAVISDGIVSRKQSVLSAWTQTRFLRSVPTAAPRGWLLITMRIIDAFGDRPFDLAEVYDRKSDAARLFPGNNNIEAKLRQQMQIMRDMGLLEFLGHGRYRRIGVQPPAEHCLPVRLR